MEDKNKNKPVKAMSVKQRSNTLLAWVCVVAIAVITYMVFLPSLDNGFTNWDDDFYVTANPLVMSDTVQVMKILETPVTANYHPLTVLSLALNYQNGKLDPYGYHLENVIFHVLNTLLVFLFIFLLTRRNLLMASIVALFFGIHSMHVESVSWVSGRKDVLYVFFFVAGLITYLRYCDTKKIGWYLFTILLFILSCLSKGMAVVFPVILLLIDYLKGVKWERRVWLEKIPFFLIAIIFGVIAFEIQQSNKAVTAMGVFTVFQRLLFVCYGAVMYIVRLFAPFKLSAFYPYPITNRNSSVPFIFYIPPIVILAIIASVIYFFRKKEKEMVFGLLFYFVSVILVLQFVSIGRVIMADRYSYLSYIGLLFVVAYLVNKVWQNKNGIWALLKYPVMLIVIAGAVVFSYQTYARTQVWKSSETLWTDAIANYPDAYMAYYNRACYYYDNNDGADALTDLNSYLQLDPSNKYAYYMLGAIYSKFYNRYDLAIIEYSRSIILDPNFKDVYLSRAILYSNFGKNDSAMADLNMAIKLDPGFTTAYTNRGIIYYRNGDINAALSDFTSAIAADPTAADAYNDRGGIYLDNGKPDLAIADFNKAIAYDPSSSNCYYDRGLYYKTVNQFEKAIADFTTGIQLQPKNIELFYNMRGQCYADLQNYNEAISDFSKAIDIDPAVPDYWLNRSIAEEKTGQIEIAKTDALKAQQLKGK